MRSKKGDRQEAKVTVGAQGRMQAYIKKHRLDPTVNAARCERSQGKTSSQRRQALSVAAPKSIAQVRTSALPIPDLDDDDGVHTSSTGMSAPGAGFEVVTAQSSAVSVGSSFRQ